MKINKETIKELSEYLNEFNLTEIEYTDKDTKIKVSKTSATVTAAVAPIQTTSATENSKNDINKQQSTSGTKVTSPIIGTAYHAPEPGAKKFVEIGKKIKKGDTVMIVEAMKTMNHVPSTADGEVKKILIEDGQPVEFGQTLVLLK